MWRRVTAPSDLWSLGIETIPGAPGGGVMIARFLFTTDSCPVGEANGSGPPECITTASWDRHSGTYYSSAVAPKMRTRVYRRRLRKRNILFSESFCAGTRTYHQLQAALESHSVKPASRPASQEISLPLLPFHDREQFPPSAGGCQLPSAKKTPGGPYPSPLPPRSRPRRQGARPPGSDLPPGDALHQRRRIGMPKRRAPYPECDLFPGCPDRCE